mgnify:CR=1 FL=1
MSEQVLKIMSGGKCSNEKIMMTMLENSLGVLHYVINLETSRYDYVSPSSQSILGFTPDEVKSLGVGGFSARIHSDDKKLVNDNFDCRYLGQDITLHIEYRFLHRDGSCRWLCDDRFVLYDEDGSAIAIIGEIREVTAEKNLEHRLYSICNKYQIAEV